MPAYISHAIMADNLHDLLNEEGIITERKSLRYFSLLPDLIGTKINNHNENMEEYILYLINYIKSNNLANNANIKSLLYGVISHYFLDTTTHPFIYSIDFSTKSPSFLGSHQLIEGYLNYFLSDVILNSNILLVRPGFCFKGKVCEESKRLIQSSLESVYGIIQTSSIERNKRYLELLETIYKNILRDNNLFSTLTGFKDFLKVNHLSPSTLVNSQNDSWVNPFTNEESNASFLELYKEALNKCTNIIIAIEAYLNNQTPILNLAGVFDKSYDTGTTIPLQRYRKKN